MAGTNDWVKVVVLEFYGKFICSELGKWVKP